MYLGRPCSTESAVERSYLSVSASPRKARKLVAGN